MHAERLGVCLNLDSAVLAAYAWPEDIGDDVILEWLLTLNLSRCAQPQGAEGLSF